MNVTNTSLIIEDGNFTQCSNSPDCSHYNRKSLYHYEHEQKAFLIFLLFAILLGNSIVLVAVALSRRKSRMNFFIRQLAIADFLVGLLSVLPDLIQRYTMGINGLPIFCKIVKFCMALVTYGSTFVLVALSVDRLDAIARPLRLSDNGWRSRIMIIVSWGLAALYSIPLAVLFKGEQCTITLTKTQWKIYLTIIAALVFFIPAIIIACCYGSMICIIWRHNKIPKCMERVSSTKPMYPKEGYKSTGTVRQFRFRGRETSMSSRGIIPQAKIRTMKMTFVIILVFILCWSPYFVWNLLTIYQVIGFNQTNIAIHAFIQSLAPLNSAANPVIYGIFSTRICHQLRRIKFVMTIFDFFGCCIEKSDRRRIRVIDPNMDESSVNTNTSRVRFKESHSTSQEKEILNEISTINGDACKVALTKAEMVL